MLDGRLAGAAAGLMNSLQEEIESMVSSSFICHRMQQSHPTRSSVHGNQLGK